MLKNFDGHSFRPHVIITSFLIQLGGKIVTVQVEVVDAPLDYNLLLCHSWTYAMTVVVSSILQIICFSQQGKIDQWSSCKPDLASSLRPNVSFMDNSTRTSKNVDVGMYPALMGTFNLPSPISYIDSSHVYVISLITMDSTIVEVYFKTSYFEDPWVVPDPSISAKEYEYTRMFMPLSAEKSAYQAIDHTSSLMEEHD
jgi:hypothetical protein